MKRTISFLALAFVVAGCGQAAVTNAPAAPTTPDVALAALAGKRPTKAKPADEPEVAPAMKGRSPGDYVVFKFSGAFHKGSLTLTERVIAKEGTVLVVDFTLAETVKTAKGTSTKEQTLRVKMDMKVGSKGEIFGVSKIENGKIVPAELADYEAMMAKTVFVADANEETIGTEATKIDVAGAAIDAQKTSYRVLIGKKVATMTLLQSDAFVWGDLGGEIVGVDGTVFYKAELVEAGSAPPPFVADTDD